METYVITLDVHNSRQESFPAMRVTLDVKGYDVDDATRRIGTVYVSKDGETVNNTGGIGDGYWYPEWSVVSIDLAHADYPHEPGRLYDCPACEAQCHCQPGWAECVYAGEHNHTAEVSPGHQDYDDDSTEF